MFERFTQQARKVVMLAKEEARYFNHNYIGTEHLLLGLLREDEGVAARAVSSLNVTLDEVREQVESIVGYGEEGTGSQASFTPRSKKVLELALREALRLGHNYIGTEHILLGLVRPSGGVAAHGVAARVLANLGVDPYKVRRCLGVVGSARRERAAIPKCPNCGSEVQDGWKFCPECGQAQAAVVPDERAIMRAPKEQDAHAKGAAEKLAEKDLLKLKENVPESWLGKEVAVWLLREKDSFTCHLVGVNDRGIAFRTRPANAAADAERAEYFAPWSTVRVIMQQISTDKPKR